jgi:Na+/H+ antiporter NhaD/arsenite permease-like protein
VILPAFLAAAMSTDPTPWMLLPFVLMLAAIAVAPLTLKHHWERYYHFVALVLGGITASYYLLVLREPGPLLHVAAEYVGFMGLIASLYLVCGGIHVRVKGQATPAVNCLFLLIGAVLANVIGTTGASMLMVRPWLRMNRFRVTEHHVVFFIFIVSNVGGCLTPIGDPPLFLGFLRGVPFWWVLEHCWEAWLIALGLLLAIFYVIDRQNFHRAPREVREPQTAHEEWRFEGLWNIAFLAVILIAVFLPAGIRESLMVIAAAGSWLTTKRAIHEANEFTFHPIKEVAWLFAGIFVTMVPALRYLELHSASLGLRTEMQVFWLTGTLSAALDNAPTYLAFLASAFGITGLDLESSADMQLFITQHARLLLAISLGAVFFGAFTYIGNGPNLMVKAIAEHQKVATPNFLRYILCFAIPILLPVLFLIGILFFSRWRLF